MAGTAESRADHGQIGCVPLEAAPVDDVLSDWRRDAARSKDRKYMGQVEKWLKGLSAHAGIASWRSLEARHVSAYLDSLAASGRTDAIGRPIKAGGGKTVNSALSAIRSFLDWCIAREILTRNVAQAVSWSRHTKITRRAFSSAEVRALIAAAVSRGAPERAMLYAFLAVSGLRIGTAERLRWKHVDLSGPVPVIRVPASILKQKRDMVVQLSEQDVPQIRSMMADGPSPDQLLFGQRPHRNVLIRDCEKAGIAAKDPFGRGAGFHALRRFVGTELARAKVSPKVAKDRLGHRDIRTTLEFYTDEFNLGDEDIHAANLLASKVYGDTHSGGRLEAGRQVDIRAESGHHRAAESAMFPTTQISERSVPGVCAGADSAPEGAERSGPFVRHQPPVGVGRFSEARASGVEPETRSTSPGRATAEEIRLQELRLAHRLMDLAERLLTPGRLAQGAADVDAVPPAHARKGQRARADRSA